MLAFFTLLTTSVIAIYKDDIKARLAYSTISQLSYITLGGALASSMAKAKNFSIDLVVPLRIGRKTLQSITS